MAITKEKIEGLTVEVDEIRGDVRDLREYARDAEVVKRIASEAYGFQYHAVEPLEVDGKHPAHYCMFEVCGIQYQVRDGVISVYSQER